MILTLDDARSTVTVSPPKDSKPQHEDMPLTVLAAPPTPVKRKRKVRFVLSSNTVQTMLHVKDMSDEDIEATWYQPDEMTAIKKDLITIIKRVMKGERFEETSKQTFRGLEIRTKEGALKRQNNKTMAVMAVLQEQARQIRKGIRDDQRIREKMDPVTSKCARSAHAMALIDELIVRKENTKLIFKLERKYNKPLKPLLSPKPSAAPARRMPPRRSRSMDDSMSPSYVRRSTPKRTTSNNLANIVKGLRRKESTTSS